MDGIYTMLHTKHGAKCGKQLAHDIVVEISIQTGWVKWLGFQGHFRKTCLNTVEHIFAQCFKEIEIQDKKQS